MSALTFDQAKAHLRVEGCDEDTLIQLYLNAARRAAELYLNRTIYDEDAGSDLDGIVMSDDIKVAILLQLGHLYENRESVSFVQGSSFPEMQLGYRYLLNPYRLDMGV